MTSCQPSRNREPRNWKPHDLLPKNLSRLAFNDRLLWFDGTIPREIVGGILQDAITAKRSSFHTANQILTSRSSAGGSLDLLQQSLHFPGDDWAFLVDVRCLRTIRF